MQFLMQTCFFVDATDRSNTGEMWTFFHWSSGGFLRRLRTFRLTRQSYLMKCTFTSTPHRQGTTQVNTQHSPPVFKTT